MKNTRLIVMVAVGAVLIAGAYIYKMQANGAKAAEFHAKALQMIKMADAYKMEPAYLDGLMEPSSGAAAASGGVFAPFTEEAYLTAFFQAVVDQAQKDGRQELARSVRAFAVGRGYVDVKAK